MSSFIISGSRGTDDPTMATLPFMAAKTAKEQGHDVVLWLWNEAVTLGRKGTADHVQGVNLNPLKDLLSAVQAAGVPIWVCAEPVRWPGRSADPIWWQAPPLRACRTTSRPWPSGKRASHSNREGEPLRCGGPFWPCLFC